VVVSSLVLELAGVLESTEESVGEVVDWKEDMVESIEELGIVEELMGSKEELDEE